MNIIKSCNLINFSIFCNLIDFNMFTVFSYVWERNMPKLNCFSPRLNKSSDCSLLQKVAFLALLGINPPNYVASYGNSDVRNAADWVKIINNKPENSVCIIIV